MAYRWIYGAAALVLLAGCQGDPAPVANQTANVAAPVETPANAAAAPVAAGDADDGLKGWLTGSWSYGEDCATDFAVHYNPDGSLLNYEDEGRWTLDGDTITETITSRNEMGEDAVQKIDPPEVRRYTVTRTDAKHGVLLFEGKKIPILRC